MHKTYQITRSAELTSLSAFRELIKGAAQDWPQIDAQKLYDLQLAVDEAATNIIQHGYAGMNPGSIILRIQIDENRARLTLTDFGHVFEPAPPPTPNVEAALEDGSKGGFGLFFIYQAMDEVDYQTSLESNTLILVKNL